MITVIDVSEHNGTIDWTKAKPHISGAIIRMGYGSDQINQDDKMWARNVSECERLGIPWGTYLYSYANTSDKIRSEIAHAKRLLSGHKPQLPVFYDLEERRYKESWGEAAGDWCREIRAAGYIDGLYSWAWAINGSMPACASAYWVADYGVNDGKQHTKPTLTGGRTLTAWQYTSKGRCEGISSSGLDVSEFYVDYAANGKTTTTTPTQKTAKKSDEEIASEVINGAWGSGQDRINRLTQAGYNPSAIQNIVNSKLKPTPRIDLEVQCLHRGRSGKKVGGGEICMADDAIVGLSIGATMGRIEYRVHKLGGGWFSHITKCDWKTSDAYAGDLRSMIDGVQIYFSTDTKQTGGKYYKVKYQVKTSKRGWLGEIFDTNWESGCGSHTAGVFGDPIIGIRAVIVPA